ncbi:MAG: hypothetical protein IJI24_01900 [Lachnospiraceae bacterium]|nr:hypothetical protein [Lachnospiraceae bacterium]
MSELEKMLQDGEHVVWRGKAETFTILDGTNKSVFFLRLILCTLICIVVEILYVISATSTGADIKLGLMVIIFIACAASPLLFLSRSRKLRKYQYVATNMGLFTVYDQIRSMPYKRISSYVFKKDADGHTSLLCGKKGIAAKPGKWREIAYFGNPGDDGVSPCDQFGFYAVDTPDKLEDILKEMCKEGK